MSGQPLRYRISDFTISKSSINRRMFKYLLQLFFHGNTWRRVVVPGNLVAMVISEVIRFRFLSSITIEVEGWRYIDTLAKEIRSYQFGFELITVAPSTNSPAKIIFTRTNSIERIIFT